MKVKELKSEGLSHELEITIPANDIDARLDVKLQEVGKTVRIPGFRPGKVPLKMLKDRYGKAILGEVLEAAVNETSAEAMDKQKLKPAMQPKIEVKSKDFGDGNDLVYTMVVDVLPEFKVADFKKAKLTKPVAKPSDKDINDALEKIASNNTSTKKIEGDRKTKDGDTVVMDFHGRTADDNVAHEGMHAHGHKLKIGSGQFIPGFEEQLVGHKAGAKVEVKVSFPEQYQAAELAGREAIFDVDIHEIHEDAEAQVDDEFAQSLGLDDLDALKAAVGDQLGKEFDSQSRMALKKDLLDFLDDAHDFEIPPTMLEMENQNILDQIKLDRQRNGEEEELTKAEEKEFKEIAERRVRLGLVLSEVGNAQNIQVSDQELQQAVIREAQRFPGQEKDVFDYYTKNRNAVESLRAPLFEDKVVDYILELASVTEKDVTPDELMNILDQDSDEKPKAKKKPSAKKADAKDDSKDDAEKKPAAKKAPAKKKAAAK
ncbi:MAG: trigger factor [Alphaproteobacteria bacterium]|nr:trigger factor [Alphaproteobacteria bacterium]